MKGESLSDWKERLLQEQDELCMRIGRLAAFIDSDDFSELGQEDQDLLVSQIAHMGEYAAVLRARVHRMKAEQPSLESLAHERAGRVLGLLRDRMDGADVSLMINSPQCFEFTWTDGVVGADGKYYRRQMRFSCSGDHLASLCVLEPFADSVARRWKAEAELDKTEAGP